MKNHRVFIAAVLDRQARTAAKNIYKKLKRKHWPVSWEPITKLHITLAFLGWIPDPHIDQTITVCQSVAQNTKPITLDFKGLGAFPDLVSPHVIWMGLKGDLKGLARLYKKLQAELIKAGLTVDEKPFTPHVTIGRTTKQTRFKQRRVIGQEIAKLRKMAIPQQWYIDRLYVLESTLNTKGSHYTTLRQIELTG